MNIHICIISKQLLANIIPILMNKPNKVIALYSEKFKHEAQTLKEILEKQSIKTHTIGNLPDKFFQDIRNFIDNIKNELEEYKSEKYEYDITLNITGGTKLMSLALIDVFRDTAREIIYTDTAHDHIEYLKHPLASKQQKLRSVLDINSYLAAYGFNAQAADSDEESWQETAKRHYRCSKFLVDNIQETASFIVYL